MPPAASEPVEAIETNISPTSQSGILDPEATNAQAQWSPHAIIQNLPPNEQVIPANPDPASPVPFFHLLERLKTTKREGWRRFNIAHGESIADHMYRMSIITMFAPPSLSSRIDVNRCTKMALIHDMAESLVGDITPKDGVLKSEKSRRESTTMDYMCDELLGKVHGGIAGQEMRKIWQEYEDGETLESKFVHDVDKFELILQMLDYERNNQDSQLDLGEFTWVSKRIELPEVKDWCDQLLQERREFWEKRGKTPSGAIQSVEKDEMMQEYYGRKENGQ